MLHVDTAPWNGWLRIALPILQFTILLITITIIALGGASSALIERRWDVFRLEQLGQISLPETSYPSTHNMNVRIQLVCFYMFAPLVMLAFITGEIWSLFTNDLASLYVVFASIFSIFIWALEIGFWTTCKTKSGEDVPDLCPIIFKHGKDDLFELSGLGTAQAAVYMAAVLVILYFVYMCLGVFVFHRERAHDQYRKWIGAQKRASILRSELDEEARKSIIQEAAPMIESRASTAQTRADRSKTVTWE